MHQEVIRSGNLGTLTDGGVAKVNIGIKGRTHALGPKMREGQSVFPFHKGSLGEQGGSSNGSLARPAVNANSLH